MNLNIFIKRIYSSKNISIQKINQKHKILKELTRDNQNDLKYFLFNYLF